MCQFLTPLKIFTRVYLYFFCACVNEWTDVLLICAGYNTFLVCRSWWWCCTSIVYVYNISIFDMRTLLKHSTSRSNAGRSLEKSRTPGPCPFFHGWLFCSTSSVNQEAEVSCVSSVHKVKLSRLGVLSRASNEGYPKVREDFTTMEKAPTRHY